VPVLVRHLSERGLDAQAFETEYGQEDAADLGAWATEGVESENRRFHQNRPQQGQFLPDLPPHSPAMGQKDGEKWTAAGGLQPTTLLPPRLPISHDADGAPPA
jgi:hypothetical protein